MWRICSAAVVTLALISGCAPLIDSFEDIGKLGGILTYTPDPRSGDKSADQYLLQVITKYDNVAPALIEGDAELKKALGPCARGETPPKKLKTNTFALDLPGAITALGQLAFNQVIASIKGRIEAIEERNTASYYVRRAWGSGPWPSWQDTSCIIIERRLNDENYAKALKNAIDGAAVKRVHMRLVLQRRQITAADGKSGSIIWPIYARIDRAAAETAVATTSAKANIRLSANIVLSSLAGNKDGQASIREIVNFQFKPIGSPLGEVAKVCEPWTSMSNPLDFQICDLATGLFADPTTGAATHVTFVITETGSALSEAKAALVALESVKKAAQPAITDILKQVSTRFK